jgi:hypothetical protein
LNAGKAQDERNAEASRGEIQMEIVIGVLVLGVVIHFIAGSRKMARWNNEPGQQQLIQLLTAARPWGHSLSARRRRES